MRVLSPFLTLLSVIVCSIAAIDANAQSPAAGTIDSSFSADGQVIATLPGHSSQAHAMAALADGSSIVVGQAWAGGTGQAMLLAKFQSNGDLDTTFGTGGFVTYAPNTALVYAARQVKVLSNGRILVGGDYNGNLVLVRFMPDGSVDNTFSFSPYSPGGTATLTGMALQSNGSIIVSADRLNSGGDTDGVITRFNASGSQDNSFASYNRYYAISGTGNQSARSVVVQADDKIVFGGTMAGTHHYVSRLLSTGLIDSNFGQKTFSASSSSNESVEALALDPDQNILILATNSAGGEANDVVLMRRTPSGVLDTTFSQDGYLLTSLGGIGSQPTNVLVQTDGRIVIAGHQPVGVVTAQVKLRRFEWNGDVDSSWGTAGLTAHAVGTSGAQVAGLAELSDRKILVACGAFEHNFLKGLGLLRLNPGEAMPETALTITTPPQSQTTNIGDAVTLSVTVDYAGEAPLLYSWYKDSSTLIGQGSSPSLTLNPIVASHEGTYHVVVSAGRLKRTSAIAQLTVRQPPVITSFPTSKISLLQGSYGQSLSVFMSGRRPFTVRWFKGNEEVNATSTFSASSTFYLSYAQPSDAGLYDVVVSNSDGETTSAEVEIEVVADPSVSGEYDLLIPVGETLGLYVTFHTQYQYRSSWTKNGKTVKTQVPGEEGLTIYSADLADAGAYQVSLKTLAGNTESDPMRVGIVDVRARRWIAANGSKFELSIPAAGPDLVFQWFKNEEPVTEPKPGHSKLTFTSVSPSDEGEYICKIQLGEQTLTTEAQTLTLTDTAPVLTDITLQDAFVGVTYEHALELPALASHFEVKGLPAGLTFFPDTSTIRGVPSKIGEAEVSITAVNPVGRSITLKVNLSVNGLPDGISGRFYGIISSNDGEGFLDVTITATGSYSGKLSLSKMYGKVTKSSLSGSLTTEAQPGVQPESYSSTTQLSMNGYHPGTENATLMFDVGNHVLSGNITISYEIDGYPNTDHIDIYLNYCPWKKSTPLASSYLGVFNLGLPSGYSTGMPAGTGYARAMVAAPGTVSLAGKLSDGSSFTASSPVDINSSVDAFSYLYKNYGRVRHVLSLSPGSSGPDYLNASLNGDYNWLKNADSLKGQKNYPIVFNSGHSILGGGKYLKPNHPSGLVNSLMMNFVEANSNAAIDLPFGTSSGTLGKSHSIKFDSDESDYTGIKSIKFNTSSGIFKGSGSYVEYVEVYDEQKGEYYYKRIVTPYTCEGLVVRGSQDLVSSAHGFSLLSEWFERDDESGKLIRLKVSYPVSIYSTY